MMAKDKDETPDNRVQVCNFDTDFVPLAVNNCASICLTPCLQDFVGKTTACNCRLTGIGSGKAQALGTIQWLFLDDFGKQHTFDIKDAPWVKDLDCRLLSPQHWAQNQEKGTAECVTTNNSVTLKWNQGRHSRSIPLSKVSNIATIQTAPAYKGFKAYKAKIDSQKPKATGKCTHAEAFPKNEGVQEDSTMMQWH